MSKYTTGEVAKLCGVTVRTVQYYDTRGILIPSELSEGGRRLYSENDLRRMKIICFLREIGLPISSIGDFLTSENPGDVIALLLEQQEAVLRDEIAQRQAQLELLGGIHRELKSIGDFSVETIGDIAHIMSNKQHLRKLHTSLLLMGIPICILQWSSVILWIVTGIWWPFVLYVLVMIPYAVWISRYYFNRVEYICPQCHAVFKPSLKAAFWAGHTPTLRKLTCPHCGQKGWCVETYRAEGEQAHG